METTSRKFEPIVNQGQQVDCPTETACPHPLPPPEPCPFPHGHMFQGCIAYINSYIDVRMRQLYNKLKGIVHGIAGRYFGPWDHILLRDQSDPDAIHRVYVVDGSLRSEPVDQATGGGD